jgi:hypothetical protein
MTISSLANIFSVRPVFLDGIDADQTRLRKAANNGSSNVSLSNVSPMLRDFPYVQDPNFLRLLRVQA